MWGIPPPSFVGVRPRVPPKRGPEGGRPPAPAGPHSLCCAAAVPRPRQVGMKGEGHHPALVPRRHYRCQSCPFRRWASQRARIMIMCCCSRWSLMGHAFFLLSRRRHRGSVPRARASLPFASQRDGGGREGALVRPLARILLCFLALVVSSCIVAAAARPTLALSLFPRWCHTS